MVQLVSSTKVSLPSLHCHAFVRLCTVCAHASVQCMCVHVHYKTICIMKLSMCCLSDDLTGHAITVKIQGQAGDFSQ